MKLNVHGMKKKEKEKEGKERKKKSYLFCSIIGRFQCILYTSTKAQRDDFFLKRARFSGF
jgi:hypothetical protein